MTAGAMTPKTSGCSKRPSSKAAGESKPEACPLGYVEDFDEPRTTLADFFSILLDGGSENGLDQFLNAALHIGVVGNRASNRNVAGSVGRHTLPDKGPGIDQ